MPEPGDLDLGARQASSSRLGELAARLPPGYRWEDLVVPERQRELLQSISAYLRHRDRVLSDWGYEKTVARTQGLKVLFAGESGTGKTMAAQVLAAELGLEIFRVDLATTVSKYIGETEKNLDRIFGAAEGSNAILFFDEADALFGKRSEVGDSHDRYANIEVAYLLQKMEGYPGAVILATNFRRNIDDAFVRRLDFVIDFPFPEADDRRRIWDRVLPEEAPRAEDVDLDFLSEKFKLSGGAIRNCSLAAAFQAADDDSSISMRHLVRAVAQEYGKQGRLTLEADFERFHDVIRVGGGRANGADPVSAGRRPRPSHAAPAAPAAPITTSTPATVHATRPDRARRPAARRAAARAPRRAAPSPRARASRLPRAAAADGGIDRERGQPAALVASTDQSPGAPHSSRPNTNPKSPNASRPATVPRSSPTVT